MRVEVAQALAVTDRQVGERLATAEGLIRFAHLQAAVRQAGAGGADGAER